MKKVLFTLLLVVGVMFAAQSQSVSTANVKKNKNTGCYTKKSYSSPKSYERKKFVLAEVFQSRSAKNATENEKKPMVSRPRNSYANNDQSVIKSKHGVTNK